MSYESALKEIMCSTKKWYCGPGDWYCKSPGLLYKCM